MDYQSRRQVLTALQSDGDPDPRQATVLFLDNSSTFGGAIASLEYLVRGLLRRRVRPIVVSGHSSTKLSEDFPGVRTISVDSRVPHRNPTALLRRMRSNPPQFELFEKIGLRLGAADWHLRRTLPAALRYLRIGHAHQVDIVHLNNIVQAQLDGLLAAELLGVPCVAHARGFQNSGALLSSALRRVDRHVAISTAIADNLEEIGADRENISIVPDGIDLTRFATRRDTTALRRELGIPEGSPTFGLFGRIMKWKGTREFVLAAARVLRHLPSSHALVVGDISDGGDDYFQEVRKLSETTGVGERILFTGYREDIPALMQALDVVVHASIEPEPFGMVIVEAMAAGTPVVAADRGGPVDIVKEGVTGTLVDPRDSESLATAILHLLENPEQARSMGQNGRMRARRLFGADRYAARVREIYDDVLE